MRVLVVEDEADLASALAKALTEEGFAVDAVQDGESAAFQALHCDYAAVVLDWMLPGISGLEVLRRLRRQKATPVLVLTARDGIGDRVLGLDSGADDYLTKPFALAELCARLRALIRRSKAQPDPVLRFGPIAIDTAAREVRREGTPLHLTAKEYTLVELLALHRGKLVTRSQIYDHIYAEDDDTLSNVVEVYVANLRRKLGKEFVKTKRGLGYLVE